MADQAENHIPTADDLRVRPADYTFDQHRAAVHSALVEHAAAMSELCDAGEAEGRDFTASEKRSFDKHQMELRRLEALQQRLDLSPEGRRGVDRSQIMQTGGGGMVGGDGWSGGEPGGFASALPGGVSLSPWTQIAMQSMHDALAPAGPAPGGFSRSGIALRTGSIPVIPPLLPVHRDTGGTVRAGARPLVRGDGLDPSAERRSLPAPQPQPLDPNGVLLDTGRIPSFPTRVVDLLVNRKPLADSNTFSYLVQTLRENNAAPVADNAVKPTSRYAMEEREDRVRVIAHLSEPAPLRFFDDMEELGRFLQSEMELGLLDALEAQVVNGSGTGENLTGLVHTTGRQQQAFTTDLVTTLRKARTKLKILGETPTVWVVHPQATETIDLLREGEDGAFLNGNFAENIMGRLPVVESIAVDPATAVLADWNLMQLIIRQEARLDLDISGPLFDRNQAKLRLEGRFGFCVRRTTALCEVDLTA